MKRCGFDERKAYRNKISDTIQPFMMIGKFQKHLIILQKNQLGYQEEVL